MLENHTEEFIYNGAESPRFFIFDIKDRKKSCMFPNKIYLEKELFNGKAPVGVQLSFKAIDA